MSNQMLERTTGRTCFTADMSLPGMLYGKLVLVKKPRGRLTALDIEAAQTMPGVVTILTRSDYDHLGGFGLVVKDQPVLIGVGDEIRFIGEAVAVVVAESEREAAQAAEKVKFEIEPLPGVWDLEEAAKGDITVASYLENNVCATLEHARGDVEAAIESAPVVVRTRIKTTGQEHAYIETEAAIAYLEEGRLVVQTCTQDPYYVQREISQSLGIPVTQLRVVGKVMGGAYGGKQDLTVQIPAAMAALKTGRPVKMTLTREESFAMSIKRHPAIVDLTLAADENGKFLAFDADILTDAGCYTGRSPVVLDFIRDVFPGPYYWPSIRMMGKSVLTNNPPSGAFRGYGAPQSVIVRETIIDALAKKLNTDPITIRRQNFLEEGQECGTPFHITHGRVTMPEVFEAALNAAGDPPVSSDNPSVVQQRGICCDMFTFDIGGFTDGSGGDLALSELKLELFRDGSVGVYSASTEMGQGLTAVLEICAAEAFGVDRKDVSVVISDTDRTPRTGLSSASRATYISARGVDAAAKVIKERLLGRAARELSIEQDRLELKNHSVYDRVEGKALMSLADAANLCYREATPLSETSRVENGACRFGHSFLATIVDLEIDRSTGAVSVKKVVNAHDVGKAINPPGIVSQMKGGALQGASWILGEPWITEKGLVQTPSLSELSIPSAADLTWEYVPIIMESHISDGQTPVKGMAEGSLTTTATAIVTALVQAVEGLEMVFPATPERILSAIGQLTSD